MECDGPNHVRHGRQGHSKRLCISIKNKAASTFNSRQHGCIAPPPRGCDGSKAVKSRLRKHCTAVVHVQGISASTLSVLRIELHTNPTRTGVDSP
jgi:hypothetical protein